MNSDMKESDIEKAQLGLGHSYSRNKVQFNVHRVDNMIIQSISLLDQIDKVKSTKIQKAINHHFSLSGSQHIRHAMQRMVFLAFSRTCQSCS